MTPTTHRYANACHRAMSAVSARHVGFGGQYWYWFSAGVPVAGS